MVVRRVEALDLCVLSELDALGLVRLGDLLHDLGRVGDASAAAAVVVRKVATVLREQGAEGYALVVPLLGVLLDPPQDDAFVGAASALAVQQLLEVEMRCTPKLFAALLGCCTLITPPERSLEFARRCLHHAISCANPAGQAASSDALNCSFLAFAASQRDVSPIPVEWHGQLLASIPSDVFMTTVLRAVAHSDLHWANLPGVMTCAVTSYSDKALATLLAQLEEMLRSTLESYGKRGEGGSVMDAEKNNSVAAVVEMLQVAKMIFAVRGCTWRLAYPLAEHVERGPTRGLSAEERREEEEGEVTMLEAYSRFITDLFGHVSALRSRRQQSLVALLTAVRLVLPHDSAAAVRVLAKALRQHRKALHGGSDELERALIGLDDAIRARRDEASATATTTAAAAAAAAAATPTSINRAQVICDNFKDRFRKLAADTVVSYRLNLPTVVGTAVAVGASSSLCFRGLAALLSQSFDSLDKERQEEVARKALASSMRTVMEVALPPHMQSAAPSATISFQVEALRAAASKTWLLDMGQSLLKVNEAFTQAYFSIMRKALVTERMKDVHVRHVAVLLATLLMLAPRENFLATQAAQLLRSLPLGTADEQYRFLFLGTAVVSALEEPQRECPPEVLARLHWLTSRAGWMPTERAAGLVHAAKQLVAVYSAPLLPLQQWLELELACAEDERQQAYLAHQLWTVYGAFSGEPLSQLASVLVRRSLQAELPACWMSLLAQMTAAGSADPVWASLLAEVPQDLAGLVRVLSTFSRVLVAAPPSQDEAAATQLGTHLARAVEQSIAALPSSHLMLLARLVGEVPAAAVASLASFCARMVCNGHVALVNALFKASPQVTLLFQVHYRHTQRVWKQCLRVPGFAKAYSWQKLRIASRWLQVLDVAGVFAPGNVPPRRATSAPTNAELARLKVPEIMNAVPGSVAIVMVGMVAQFASCNERAPAAKRVVHALQLLAALEKEHQLSFAPFYHGLQSCLFALVAFAGSETQVLAQFAREVVEGLFVQGSAFPWLAQAGAFVGERVGAVLVKLQQEWLQPAAKEHGEALVLQSWMAPVALSIMMSHAVSPRLDHRAFLESILRHYTHLILETPLCCTNASVAEAFFNRGLFANEQFQRDVVAFVNSVVGGSGQVSDSAHLRQRLQEADPALLAKIAGAAAAPGSSKRGGLPLATGRVEKRART